MRMQEDFGKLVVAGLANASQRAQITESNTAFEKSIGTAKEQYSNLELAKDRAAYYKWKVLESLDKYLIEFESNVIRKGGKVLWALDAESALAEIDAIIKRVDAKAIARSHTGLGEEIGLSAFLQRKEVEIYPTNTGDYIADKAGQGNFHMVQSVMDKSIPDIATLLNDKISVSLEATAEEISDDIRNELREKIRLADLAITGANFLIAENGMVALTENEGNIRMAISFAKTHIILAGIDKVIPTINDLDIYFPLVATFATGQKITTYNTIVGPRQAGEIDGPAEFIVILIDNGRSNLLGQADQRQALSCIQCGACSHVCPVFTSIGGFAFKNGPIGAVTFPHMHGMEEYKHQSYSSTICGRCTDICPVKIDLHNHLLRNRRDSVAQGHNKSGDKMMWFSWKKMMLSRKHLNRGSSVKNFILKSFFKTAWGEQREFPKVIDKSFNQLWRERNGL